MSIDRVKKLHKDLQKPDKNYKQIIEELSEFILFGDHQNEDIFDYFAEHNILSLFYEKIKKANLNLVIFIIERMSMIITNISKPLNLNYVLSNPVLHDFINHNYDFGHPELVDYYVNFLKTIAIRINRENFYLYFNQRYCNFPLLWQAQKFIEYPDNLVKNTVQNIILSLAKLASEPNSENCTKSTIFSQSKIQSQFKTYLTCSPFIIAYCKYIRQIYIIITNLEKKKEQLEQLDDLLMFFNDLFIQCPFLSYMLEQMITNHFIQPILDCLLLNKPGQIKISCELGLFTIYTFLTKLPIVYSVMQYFCEDNVYIEDNFNNELFKLEKWNDSKTKEQDFSFIFTQDMVGLEVRSQQFIQHKQNNLKKNPYKNEFLNLLRSRDSALLYLQLVIWQVAKQNNYSIPSDHIIKLLQTQNEIVYTFDVIDCIIQLIYNEDLKELEQIYKILTDIVAKILENQSKGKKFNEGLLVNWSIIEEFDWNYFINKKLTVTLEKTNPFQDDIRLMEFKYIYIWMLIKNCLTEIKKEPFQPYKLNQEINHLERSDEFIKITNTSDYLILDEKQGYLIHSSSKQENLNIGIIKYVQPLRAIECSFQDSTLILECHKLYQNYFRSYKLQFNEDSIKAVINRIYQAQCHVSEQIINKFQALLQ